MLPSDRPRPARPETRDLAELRALKVRLPELAPAIDMQVELVELHRRIQLRVSTPSPVPSGERQGRLRQGRRALELARRAHRMGRRRAGRPPDGRHPAPPRSHRTGRPSAILWPWCAKARTWRRWFGSGTPRPRRAPPRSRRRPPARRCWTTCCNWRCGRSLGERLKWPNAGSTWRTGAGPGVRSAERLPTLPCTSTTTAGSSSAAAASAAGTGRRWGVRGVRHGIAGCCRPSPARTGGTGSAPAMAAAAT